MSKFFKIGLWNANGLGQHEQEVKAFIISHNIDIMLISETHFTNRSYFKLSKYNFYGTNHPDGTAHGGTAIIIKASIKHFECNRFSENYLQSTRVVVEDWNGPLTVSAVYCPPRHSISYDHFLNYYNTLGNRFMAAGDYNAKHTVWGSRLITPKGRQLHKVILNNNMNTISTGEPTYWPTDRNKTPDLVDFAVSKGIPSENAKAFSCFDLSSDHSPVLFTLCTEILLNPSAPRLGSKHTNWDNFRMLIQDNLNTLVPLKTNTDIDNAVEYLNQIIQNSIWKSTPAQNRCTKVQELPNLIKGKIAEKRGLRKLWQVTRSPENKTRLNQITRQLKGLLNNHKNSNIERYLQNLTATEATEYSLWKAVKKLNKGQQHNPPIRTVDGTWAKSNKEKAEAFAEHLVNVFQPNPADINLNVENEVNEYLNTPYQLDLPPKKFTVKEVQEIINNNLNPKKSPGYDLISGKILKKLPRKGILFLTQLFNAVLRTGHFPLQWKVGQIIVIQKPGKPINDVKSYRPISLLPIVSKILEKLLLARLEPILIQQQVIPNHQFGFRPQHATTEQIHRVCNHIYQSLEEKKYCSAVFLDISQAFDRVWHRGLLYKVRKIIPHTYFLILCSYLQNRHYLVKYHDALTSLYPIDAGVPQGSVLGPVLYLVFTADLPTQDNIVTATYADDTALLSSHQDPNMASILLQTNLNKIQRWLKIWRIRVNETKSVHVTFTNRRETCPPVVLNGHQLIQKEEAKYLGMHLDRKLLWRTHIFTKRKQLGIRLNQLYWMIGRKSKLSLENKILIYKTIIKPIWSYGVQLWGTASLSNIEILERYQSKVLRIITDAPWYVSNKIITRDLHINSVKEEISKFSKSYAAKIQHHPNNLAKHLMEITPIRRRLKKISPYDLLNRF